jgi:rhomboid protease GluP
MWRQTTGSVLCPACGQLVGVNDPQCLSCGRRNPGMWGFAALLRNVGDDMGFTQLVMWACGAIYLATLVVDFRGMGAGGILSLLSPSDNAMILFGAAGYGPVFQAGRWWTVLSAGWLHGSVLHIVFNMMAVRDLLPGVAHLYGPARTVIVYTLASVAGFTASSVAYLLPLPRVMRGGYITLGASAAIFGLIGALAWYGRRGGSTLIQEHAKRMALGGFVFGFLMPGIDNWAHLGGFVGGYLAARVLDPLKPERGDHMLIALFCMLLQAAAIVGSIVTALPWFRS